MNTIEKNERWFDALEDFRGPDIRLDYTPEQDEYYRKWLAKREAKLAEKTAADHERETRAATMAFYMNEDNILNERSPFDDE